MVWALVAIVMVDYVGDGSTGNTSMEVFPRDLSLRRVLHGSDHGQSMGQWGTEGLARAVPVRSSLAGSEVNVTVHTGDHGHLFAMQLRDSWIPGMHT